MPRRPRLQFAGAVYHVMARGNRKATIFLDDLDRRQFLRIVGDAAASYHLRIRAFCLMGNHYHLVLETPESNLSQAMQFINGVYAQRANRRHKLTGHVFEGRFRSLIIQRESYLIRAARYVVRNPVRAHLVADAVAWRWSSYRATAGLEPPPPWLDIDWIQWVFRADSLPDAQQRYADYVNAPVDSQRPIPLNATILGSKQFGKRLLDAVRNRKPDSPVPRTVQVASRPALAELFDGMETLGRSRDQHIRRARVEHGYSFAEIARHLGIDRSTASKAARRSRRKDASSEIQAN